MRIGYACLNRSIRCTPAGTFRLRSYSDERFVRTVAANLDCLERMLRFNAERGIRFLRISSDLIPFASHPALTYDWRERFKERFSEIGAIIRRAGMRISMHPDQFTLINSPGVEIFERSAAELRYHAGVLNLLGLDRTAKIQIHGGGVYGDKTESLRRFVRRYRELDEPIRHRLVVENDDHRYTVADCLSLSSETGIPVLFDTLHHTLNPSIGTACAALEHTAATWRREDGLPLCDYSTQLPGGRPGRHAESLDAGNFLGFLGETSPLDFDIMLEIKDKETSALRAIAAASGDPRLVTGGSMAVPSDGNIHGSDKNI